MHFVCDVKKQIYIWFTIFRMLKFVLYILKHLSNPLMSSSTFCRQVHKLSIHKSTKTTGMQTESKEKTTNNNLNMPPFLPTEICLLVFCLGTDFDTFKYTLSYKSWTTSAERKLENYSWQEKFRSTAMTHLTYKMRMICCHLI